MGKGAGGMKRTQHEKDERDEASRKFYAEEVCWGLTIALNMGMDWKQAFFYISDDFDKWGSFVEIEEGLHRD